MSTTQYKARLNTGYARLYWGTFNQFELSANEAVLMALIWSLSLQSGWCWMSRGHLAQRINVSAPTIDGILRSLRKKGLIEFGSKSSYGTNQIRPSQKWTTFTNKIHALLSKKKADSDEDII